MTPYETIMVVFGALELLISLCGFVVALLTFLNHRESRKN